MDAVRFRLRIFLVVLLVVMFFGILGFMIIEGLSLADAFYFTIVTIATVGYGDIHPATQTGKILTVLLIITGVGTFLGVVANATEMMLNRRERQTRLAKLNMVRGLFFSEVGTKLLAYFAELDPQVYKLREEMIVSGNWSEAQFLEVKKRLKEYSYHIDIEKLPQAELNYFLNDKGNILLRLLENPSVFERESFAELIRAVLHFKDELAHRPEVRLLPESDKEHLVGDLQRAYRLLAQQWLDYMKNLKDSYPYLFSLAMRTNPFDQEASPILK